MRKSVKQIEKIIRQEINCGISPQKIMVMGHSQGGSVALTMGLLTEYKLAGIVCLSGFLPCWEEIFNWAKAENKVIPFWIYHNYYDKVVPCWVGKESTKFLKEKGYQVDFSERISSGHFFTPTELEKIITETLNQARF